MDHSGARITRRAFLRRAGGAVVGLTAAGFGSGYLAGPGRAAARPAAELDLKIGQMVMAGFRGTALAGDNPILSDLGDRALGGVVLFDVDLPGGSRLRNIESPGQLAALDTALQRAAALYPLLIAADQEGGMVARLGPEHGFPPSLSEGQLGAAGDLAATRRNAETMAQTLRAAGVNLNLAPVVDLNLNPNNPIIGRYERSFSADPQVVTQHALVAIEAHHRHGVLTTLKHFPGHGSSTADSHLGFVDVTGAWSAAELQPYQNIIEAGKCDAVMTAHIFNARLDPQAPATLSPPTLTGILRERLGYDGVVLSDDMTMGAIADNYGFEEAIRLALVAGVDILTYSNNGRAFDPNIVRRVVAAIRGLVNAGTISERRIDESYRRIMRLKWHADFITRVQPGD